MSVEVVISVVVVVAEEVAVELTVSVLAMVVAVTPRWLQMEENLVAGRWEMKAALVERSGDSYHGRWGEGGGGDGGEGDGG